MSAEVTSAGGARPVVVLRGPLPGFADRLARAGFAAVAFAPDSSVALNVVLDALARGALGALGVPTRGVMLVERRDDASIAVTRLPPGEGRPAASAADLRVPAEPAPEALRAVVHWLARHAE